MPLTKKGKKIKKSMSKTYGAKKGEKVFYASINKGKIKGASDAIEAAWFPINDIPKLAFDHHIVLNNGVFTDVNIMQVASQDRSVPYRGAFVQADAAYDGCVGCNEDA